MGKPDLTVLDLFSAAAGGWSLGMHRAGFRTIAACEWIAWRRALYAENNPGVLIYGDVCDVTAERIYADTGTLPWLVAGSPPCQDISSANTKGKGVDGERSVLFFEAVRIAGEIRALARKLGIPGARWVALENSSNLRNRGSDRVLTALAQAGYPCEPFVVGAGDDFRTGGRKTAGVGANHERARSWLLAYDPEQLADPDGAGRPTRWSGWRGGVDLSVPHDPVDAAQVGHAGGWPRRHGPDGHGASPASSGGSDASDAAGDRRGSGRTGRRAEPIEGLSEQTRRDADSHGPHANENGQPNGAVDDEMGGRESTGGDAEGPWSQWNGSFARHLQLDDGLSTWLAGARVAIGDGKGVAAASLVVEAFGDAVVPQIPEAIGRAILRTEEALAAIIAPGRAA